MNLGETKSFVFEPMDVPSVEEPVILTSPQHRQSTAGNSPCECDMCTAVVEPAAVQALTQELQRA